jgi:hypothetical protein
MKKLPVKILVQEQNAHRFAFFFQRPGKACGAMSQEIGVMSQSADSVSAFLRTTRGNFREEKLDTFDCEKLRINFPAEHNGTIAMSKLSDCPIRISMLFSR